MTRVSLYQYTWVPGRRLGSVCPCPITGHKPDPGTSVAEVTPVFGTPSCLNGLFMSWAHLWGPPLALMGLAMIQGCAMCWGPILGSWEEEHPADGTAAICSEGLRTRRSRELSAGAQSGC